MSTELASDTLGASIMSASSFDITHPPSSIIDGISTSFWLTTGSFPQEFVLQLGETSTIKSVELVSCGVKSLELYKTEGMHANSWEKLSSNDADDSDGEVQRLTLKIPPKLTATFLRIKICSGWSDCISVHKLSVIGSGGGSSGAARK